MIETSVIATAVAVPEMAGPMDIWMTPPNLLEGTRPVKVEGLRDSNGCIGTCIAISISNYVDAIELCH